MQENIFIHSEPRFSVFFSEEVSDHFHLIKAHLFYKVLEGKKKKKKVLLIVFSLCGKVLITGGLEVVSARFLAVRLTRASPSCFKRDREQ